jgi:hypothetical protein
MGNSNIFLMCTKILIIYIIKMNTSEILSIVALSLLGLCLLCGLSKTVMKKDSDKKNCDKACSLAIFAAVALVGVSQLFTEEKYRCQDLNPPKNPPSPGCNHQGGGNMANCGGLPGPGGTACGFGGPGKPTDCPQESPCCCALS